MSTILHRGNQKWGGNVFHTYGQQTKNALQLKKITLNMLYQNTIFSAMQLTKCCGLHYGQNAMAYKSKLASNCNNNYLCQ